MTRAAGLRLVAVRVVQVTAAVALLSSILFLPFAGRYLARDEPLQRADAIMVLGGARIERWLEAVDLYKEGWAPRILLSPGQVSPLEAQLHTRGVYYPREGDLARDAILALGVPANAVTVFPNGVDNTAAEAVLLRNAASAGGLRKVIVVTSAYHVRRAGYAFRRELKPAGVEIIMRASRHDDSQPARWWRARKDIRFIMSELPKLAAYLAGLGE